jgi:cell division protein FtsL
MKKNRQPSYKKYQQELIVLLFAIIASAGMLVFAVSYYQDVHQESQQTQNLQNNLNREIDSLIEEQQLYAKIGRSFNHIATLGFYGEEDRLTWVENLKKTIQLLELPHFKYAISPQQKIKIIGHGFTPELSVYETIMDIEAGLLHEGDFLQISSHLAEVSTGMFRIKDCALVKGSEIVTNKVKQNLELKCSLAWYTVKQSNL